MSDPVAPRPPRTRIPCPVCLATKMGFITIPTSGADLVLDHCDRCGGVWFDGGEVAAIRALGPTALLTRVRPRRESFRMRCRDCDALVPRDQPRCHACGHDNALRCPRCDQTMRVAPAGSIRIDLCDRCHGLWLDNHELREVWKLGFQRARGRAVAAGGNGLAAGQVSGGVAEAFLYAPDLAFYGLDAGAHLLAAGAGPAASGLAAAFEAVGAAAEAAFEIILEAIAAILG